MQPSPGPSRSRRKPRVGPPTRQDTQDEEETEDFEQPIRKARASGSGMTHDITTLGSVGKTLIQKLTLMCSVNKSTDVLTEQNIPQPGFIAKAAAHGISFVNAYEELLKPYPDRRKNFEVDLSSLLEVYLQKVLGGNVEKQEEILNFAKAGLMLQNTTLIYSRKVEFLQELTMQMIGFAESGVAAEADEENGEESADGAPRRKSNKPSNDGFTALNIKSHKTSLKLRPQKIASQKKLQFRPVNFPCLMTRDQCEQDKKRISILNPGFQGDKTTFRLWGPISSKSGFLCQDLFDIKNKFSSSLDPANEEPPDSPIDMEVDNEPFNDNNSADDDASVTGGEVNEPVLEPTPMDVEPEAASLNKEKQAPPVIDAATSETEKLNDDWKDMDFNECVPELGISTVVRQITKEPQIKKFGNIQDCFINHIFLRLRKPKSYFGDEGFNEGIDIAVRKKTIDLPRAERGRPKKSVAEKTKQTQKLAGMELFDEADSDSENLLGFSSDGQSVYQDKIIENPIVVNDIEDNWEEPMPEQEDLSFPAEGQEDAASTSKASTSQAAKELSDDPNQVSEDLELAQRLEKWFSKINTLQEVESRKPPFKFHPYCTKVLKTFAPEQKELKFLEIVQGLEAGQTARYLLATLQLANTNNVQISHYESNKVSNETMTVTLLNKTRALPMFEDDEDPQT